MLSSAKLLETRTWLRWFSLLTFRPYCRFNSGCFNYSVLVFFNFDKTARVWRKCRLGFQGTLRKSEVGGLPPQPILEKCIEACSFACFSKTRLASFARNMQCSSAQSLFCWILKANCFASDSWSEANDHHKDDYYSGNTRLDNFSGPRLHLRIWAPCDDKAPCY